MPDKLRWSWCNNNRNKVHNKCNVLESSQNQAAPPPRPRTLRLWKNCFSWNLFLVPKRLGTASKKVEDYCLNFTLLTGSAQVGRMIETLSLPAPLVFLTNFSGFPSVIDLLFSVFPCHLIFPIVPTLAFFHTLMSSRSTQHSESDVKVAQSCQNTEVASQSLLPGNLPNPRIKLGSPALQVYLPTELSGTLLSLEKGKATHSSILAWRIPWTV